MKKLTGFQDPEKRKHEQLYWIYDCYGTLGKQETMEELQEDRLRNTTQVIQFLIKFPGRYFQIHPHTDGQLDEEVFITSEEFGQQDE